MSNKKIKKFNSEQEASDWMYNEELSDENCTDNYRFAFEDDGKAMMVYKEIQDTGCCGSFDEQVIVSDRVAHIGCNYGH